MTTDPLRTNFANTLFHQGKIAEAAEQYQLAIDEMREALPESPQSADLAQLTQALCLNARVLVQLDQMDKAKTALTEAEQLYRQSTEKGIFRLEANEVVNYHSLCARLYRALGEPERELAHLEQTVDILYHHVAQQSRDQFWESMLGYWSAIPERLIQALFDNASHPVEPRILNRALTIAEGAKGRLMHWLLKTDALAERDQAVDEQRQQNALEAAKTWCGQSASARYVVSFYAGQHGLGIFVLDQQQVLGQWQTDFDYDRWLTDWYDPWIAALNKGTDPNWRTALQSMTHGLLSTLGQGVWQVAPKLLEGGDCLVLIPHRSLRNLPLTHLPLPNGKTVAELFDRVYIMPTLDTFTDQLSQPMALNLSTHWTGCIDPDGSLPFARLEGALCCDPEQTDFGRRATRAALENRFQQRLPLLVSCHGRFPRYQPWQSTLTLADGEMILETMIPWQQLPPLIVLGACDTARSRHSSSDEPVGFSGVFLFKGVNAVLAPLWPVNDLASLLFLTLLREIQQEQPDLARTVYQASQRLRTLTADEILQRSAAWEQLLDQGDSHWQSLQSRIRPQLAAMKRWLLGLDSDACPFSSPYDWAVYQLVGGYTDLEDSR